MGKLIDAVLVKGLPPVDIKNANKVNLWALLWASTLIATMLMQDAGTFGLMDQFFSITLAIINLRISPPDKTDALRLLKCCKLNSSKSFSVIAFWFSEPFTLI